MIPFVFPLRMVPLLGLACIAAFRFAPDHLARRLGSNRGNGKQSFEILAAALGTDGNCGASDQRLEHMFARATGKIEYRHG